MRFGENSFQALFSHLGNRPELLGSGERLRYATAQGMATDSPQSP